MKDQSTVLQVAISYLTGRGLSQVSIAKAVGKSKSVVSRWKTGSMESLNLDVGAALGNLLYEHNAETSLIHNLLVTTISHMSVHTDIDTEVADIRRAIRRDPGSTEDWFRLVILLHFLDSTKRHDEAFALGTQLWPVKRNHHDMAAYWIRQILIQTKLRLGPAAHEQAVLTLGGAIGLAAGSRPRGRYEPVQRPKLMNVADIPRACDSPWAPIVSGYPSVQRFAHCVKLDDSITLGKAFEIELREERSRFSIPQDWHTFSWLALQKAFSERGDLYESRKVRLASLDIGASFRNRRVFIQETSYLTSVVTNQSLRWEFAHAKTFKRRSLISDHLTDYELAASLSSHIGVNSLVLSRDGMLICLHQAEACRQQSERLVPFGGSLDWDDVLDELESNSPTLGGLISRGMVREVREECQVEAQLIHPLVTAMTLDLHMGMKPDFFGICFVDLDWESLEGRREPVYGGPRSAMPVKFAEGDYESSIDAAAEAWRSQDSPFLMANLALIRSSREQVALMGSSTKDGGAESAAGEGRFGAQ
ncbi:MAG: hypothetical protein K1X67_24135 [Fimbriimonadaceae bacterium]|nr:hypothetical protein [Fimbriimonadaceae bacterium]